MIKHFCSLLLSIFVMFCSFAMVSTLHAQDIDLGIRFTTDPPETVKINGFYGVKVEVFMDENTSAIPSGEIIRAKIDVIDPDGLPIDGLSYVKLWSGFQDTSNGFITNDGRFPRSIHLSNSMVTTGKMGRQCGVDNFSTGFFTILGCKC